MHTYMCIYIHTCTYIHTYVYIQINTCTSIHICVSSWPQQVAACAQVPPQGLNVQLSQVQGLQLTSLPTHSSLPSQKRRRTVDSHWTFPPLQTTCHLLQLSPCAALHYRSWPNSKLHVCVLWCQIHILRKQIKQTRRKQIKKQTQKQQDAIFIYQENKPKNTTTK